MATYKRDLIAFLEKLPDDEPIFILRAQDKFAAITVRIWCALVRVAGGNAFKIAEAEIWADEMDAWPTKKVPD